MDGAPSDPPVIPETRQAAGGGPLGVGVYARHAPTLLDNGYAPIPIRPGKKVPAVSRWSRVEIDAARVENWSADHPQCGIGLRTGDLVGVDIDILDADLAWQIGELAARRLGETLMRVGCWPKRLLLYRTDAPFPKIDAKPVEILGAGQQFVAFGTHPGTGRPYDWPGRETPLDLRLDDLPRVDHAQLLAFVAEARAFLPDMPAPWGRPRNRPGAAVVAGVPTRDAAGRITDGRDTHLSTIAFHTVHDALACSGEVCAEALADLVWTRFAETTDLSRPRKGGHGAWAPDDALRKVRDKLRLASEGRLPERAKATVTCSYTEPEETADTAREELDSCLSGFCDTVLDYYRDPEMAPPRLGIRATTGLGKSSAARQHLMRLRAELTRSGAPSRVLVFTPSHRLAEETAEAWRAFGLSTAVLRGFERQEPGTGEPMCRELDLVRAAFAARLDPQTTICTGKGGLRCRHLETCAKQRNRRQVREAEIVVAPYDALYTGFAIDGGSVGVIVVDEGCWARAIRETEALSLEGLTTDLLGLLGTGQKRDRLAAQAADRHALRRILQQALAENGPGAVRREPLLHAGLTVSLCADAIDRERSQLVHSGLRPGLQGSERKVAIGRAQRNARVHAVIALWRATSRLLGSPDPVEGRLRIGAADRKTGAHPLSVIGLAAIDDDFQGTPVLHLDATLRPEIATCLLPGLETCVVEAAQPNMSVHLVSGRFGKAAIVPDPRCGTEERARRERRLRDCADYVRWQALRNAPGRTLVVTYKAVEEAFQGIPGVETAHFNATAGLDIYGDVSALIVIGRPLPPDTALAPPCAALFGHALEGGYGWSTEGVRMRNGSVRAVRVMRHEEVFSETIRAAICDDEVIQCIGRGRGVNRAAENPLEVHVLADVALPLVHASVVDWETVQPDMLQRMLLSGLAVDSPADATHLYPEMLGSEKRAQKLFEREGFKRQIPYEIYRGMSLKSATYRRSGRGRSWQSAYWIDGACRDPRTTLQTALGEPLCWKP